MNVLKADFFRFIKDKTTYILLGIVFLMSPITCLMYSLMGNTAFTVERLLYQGLGTEILCVIIGLHLSMFIGKEYANNTIRNKLCYGETRYKIAGCFFLESLIITFLYVFVSIFSSVIFGSIFGSFAFTSGFMARLLCQIAIIIAFSFVITGIVVSTKNMKSGFMVTVLVSVIFTAISYALPMLAARFPIIEVLCRSLYMIVSTMLISSVDGIYHVGTVAFEGIYANALILSFVYITVSVGATMLAVKKHSYK